MKPVLAEVQPDKCPGPRTQSGGPHSLTPLKVDAVFLLSRPSPATLTLLVVVRGVVRVVLGVRVVRHPLPRFC